jgi:hypothetical protein
MTGNKHRARFPQALPIIAATILADLPGRLHQTPVGAAIAASLQRGGLSAASTIDRLKCNLKDLQERNETCLF